MDGRYCRWFDVGLPLVSSKKLLVYVRLRESGSTCARTLELCVGADHGNVLSSVDDL
jgi:hypothetical protein